MKDTLGTYYYIHNSHRYSPVPTLEFHPKTLTQYFYKLL